MCAGKTKKPACYPCKGQGGNRDEGFAAAAMVGGPGKVGKWRAWALGGDGSG